MEKRFTEIDIQTPYITLGQLLKLTNLFESGGVIKNYLSEHGVLVNDELEHRRGRKLYHDDTVIIENLGAYIVKVIQEN